jgi:hypothetical protein
MAWKLVIAIVESPAKLEAKQDSRTEDQHPCLVEGNLYLLRELHRRCGKQ